MNAVKMSVYYISDSVKNQDITAKEVFGYDITFNVRYYSNVRVKILQQRLCKDITSVVVSRYYNKGSVIIIALSVL